VGPRQPGAGAINESVQRCSFLRDPLLLWERVIPVRETVERPVPSPSGRGLGGCPRASRPRVPGPGTRRPGAPALAFPQRERGPVAGQIATQERGKVAGEALGGDLD